MYHARASKLDHWLGQKAAWVQASHDHVLAELNAYADLVYVGSYCIVFDTVVEDLPAGSFTDRPWDVGNNPKTAVHEWLKTQPDFEIDKDIDIKLLISVAPDGYLKRIG